VWAKTNPMPSQVRDRLALTWEVLYLLVRSKSYYFDLDTIREPHTSRAPRNSQGQLEPAGSWAGPLAATRGGLAKTKLAGRVGHPLGKNPGDVWRIATRGFTGAHFATFPPELVRRPILATCPALVCTHCGLPRRSTSEHRPMGPSCDVQAATRPGVVLDPFLGTGTVGLVAQELDRDWLGIEINPAYVQLAYERLGVDVEAAA
jgi:site-specific DNA-methyltransferase (adenine-specific)